MCFKNSWTISSSYDFQACTSSVAKEDVVFPRLLYCDSRRSQTCHRRIQVCRRRSQVLPGLSSALPGLSPALPVTLTASRNALQGSHTLLQLTHLSLHSTSSQTLLEASSGRNTFCWCGSGLSSVIWASWRTCSGVYSSTSSEVYWDHTQSLWVW